MNQICRDIFRAIHEGKWLKIEYRNKADQVTKYWIGIRDIDPRSRTMKVDGLHLGQLTIGEYDRIFIDSILSTEIIEGTYCPENKILVEDIEMHPERYKNIFDSSANLIILNYLEICNKLDTTPYITDYDLIHYIDRDRINCGMYQLTDQQFREVVAQFQYFSSREKRKSGSLKVKRLAINVLSINTNKGLYVLAYRNLNLDVKNHIFKPDEEITVCTQFSIDGKQENARKFLDADEYELLEDFEKNLEKIKDAITEHGGNKSIVDDMPYVIGLGMDVVLNLHEEYKAIMDMFEADNVTYPIKAFFGELLERPRRTKAYPIALINKNINLDQLLAMVKVAEAFVTQDPDGNGEDDTIGILGPSNSDHMNAIGGNQYGLDPLFSSFQSYPQYWLQGKDGTVEYGSIQPETRDALEKISELYTNKLIDPEMLVRSDSKEPLLAGKVGIFFGPWWSGYTVADATLAGAADWRAYFTPLSEDGNYYTHMAEPTTQYVVASKACKNPEAAFKIINYLIENQQKWVDEGISTTEMVTSDFYPLYNTYDNADEIEVSYDVLTKYLAGETTMDDVDFSKHKLLKSDMEAVKKLKKEPYDDFSLDKWNLDSDIAKNNLPRLVAILVGDAPSVNEKYVPVYNAYNGQTETMETKWANLKKMEEETFSKIVMGKADISEFDTFVKNWKSQGGDQILKEINDELSK